MRIAEDESLKRRIIEKEMFKMVEEDSDAGVKACAQREKQVSDYEVMVHCGLGKTAIAALSRRPKMVAVMLEEFNLWRRGEGGYAFDENPSADGKNRQEPLSPKLLGIALECAVHLLRNIETVGA